MKALDLNQVAEYLDEATILQTIDDGFSLIHFGKSNMGNKFFLINNAEGQSAILEFK